MSLYSKEYWSEGRARWYAIEELGDHQLVNGYRKLKRTLDAGETPAAPPDDRAPNDAEVLACMLRELERRELDVAFKHGLRPGDPRLQGGNAERFTDAA